MAKEKNIFETAANLLGKKKPQLKTEKKPSPPNSRIPLDSETQEMMNKIKYMQDDLQSKFEYIEKKKHLLGPNMARFLQDKQILTPAELKLFENFKSVFGGKVTSAIGIPPKNTTDQGPSAPTNRKGKTLGSRKKWMPIK